MALPALKVLTANRLRSGDVLYWRPGGWTEHKPYLRTVKQPG